MKLKELLDLYDGGHKSITLSAVKKVTASGLTRVTELYNYTRVDNMYHEGSVANHILMGEWFDREVLGIDTSTGRNMDPILDIIIQND